MDRAASESGLTEQERGLPAGEVLACPTMPRLTPAHISRLRKLWAFGRPVHVSALSGVELDLTIHGLVQSVEHPHSPCAVLTVTQRGVIHLNEVRQAQVAAQRPHHELGHRLSKHLRAKGFWTWENVEFGNPDWTQPRTWGVVRPDVFCCLPALKARSAGAAIYEVKVNRADFLADLAKPEKRQAYAVLAEAVYYCCPEGLIDKGEVPDGFGLLVETVPGEFSLRKKAKRAKAFELHADTAMTLMVKRQVSLGYGD
ncbi:hypothetical protein [Rubrivivax gelatinosus]|uniref:hypothetical protein n=1 Tax=Rubrivivax gelatinosus TaxID=28068 RepID=UPI0005C26201|nr:hypothetical protein [Rubrivivax gelatinosus]MBG6083161.1 hypothetical protein [Rubrivivax gelatinosus]